MTNYMYHIKNCGISANSISLLTISSTYYNGNKFNSNIQILANYLDYCMFHDIENFNATANNFVWNKFVYLSNVTLIIGKIENVWFNYMSNVYMCVNYFNANSLKNLLNVTIHCSEFVGNYDSSDNYSNIKCLSINCQGVISKCSFDYLTQLIIICDNITSCTFSRIHNISLNCNSLSNVEGYKIDYWFHTCQSWWNFTIATAGSVKMFYVQGIAHWVSRDVGYLEHNGITYPRTTIVG